MTTLRVLKDDSIEDLVGDYIAAVCVGRHTTGKRKQKTPRHATVAMYAAVLGDPRNVLDRKNGPNDGVFLAWTKSVKLTDPADLDDKALDRFVRDLETRKGKNGKPLTATTIQSYARDCSSFLRWAHKRGAVADVHMVVEEPPKPEFDLLTQAEVTKLVEMAGSLRDRIIVRILAECGCRLGELLALTVGDVRREDGVHFIAFVDREGKDSTGREYRRLKTKRSARTAAIAKDLYGDLRSYLNGDRKLQGSTEDDASIFLSARRSRKNGFEPLSDSGVQQLLKHLGEDAEIRLDKHGRSRVHAHAFRHRYATDYMNGDGKPNGQRGDPVTLARIIGHSGLTMIQKTYDKRDESAIRREMLDHLERRKRASS
jgi:integrase